MIVAGTSLASAMMMALRTTLGGEATITLYPGVRPAPGVAAGVAPIAVCALANPAGEVDMAGDFLLAPSEDAQLTSSSVPTWARFHGTGGAWVMDCDARLNTEADAGQEIVIAAPALYAGAFVRIASGAFSARP